jgi:hypothetical protein
MTWRFQLVSAFISQVQRAITCLYVGDKSAQPEMLAPSILLPLSPFLPVKILVCRLCHFKSQHKRSVQNCLVVFFKKGNRVHLITRLIQLTGQMKAVHPDRGEKCCEWQKRAWQLIRGNSPYVPDYFAHSTESPNKRLQGDAVWNILRATLLTAKLWLSVSWEQMNGLKRENDGRLFQPSTAIRIIAANFLNAQQSAPLILCVAVMR